MQNDLFLDEQHQEIIRLPMEDADVRYYPRLLGPDQAGHYYQDLQDSLLWQQDHIKLYGKQVKIPRLQAWYGEPDAIYTYSGLTMRPHRWTKSLLELKSLCENVAGSRFNSVLANWYRDGQDSMGWHADDEPELGARPIIASLSFGQARDFDFRHKLNGKKHRINLEQGSLLVMAGNTQRYWMHGISKRTRAMVGRINLTFRMIYPIEK